MTLPLPELDDIDFDQLLEQARGLIPRYAPQWTDHNIHDPGIMLLELVAWLIDQDVYQLGFINDDHIRAFAALLGVRPLPAVPAKGLIWPLDQALSNDTERPGANLAMGIPVICKELPDIPFQLAADLHITPAQILAVTGPAVNNRFASAFAGSAGLQSHCTAGLLETTFTGRNHTETTGLINIVFDRPLVERAQTITPTATVLPIAIGLQLDDPLDTPADTDLPGHVVVEYRLQDIPSQQSLQQQALQQISLQQGSLHQGLLQQGLLHQGLLQQPQHQLPEDHASAPQKTNNLWRRVEVLADSTEALNRTGLLLLNIPAEPLCSQGNTTDKQGSCLRIYTRRKSHLFAPKLSRLAVNVAPIVQQQTLHSLSSTEQSSQMSLSPSNGLPDQIYKLPLQGLITDPLVVEVGENDEWIPWYAVENLQQQGPCDRVFVIDRERELITFGNGVNGAIPPLGASIRHRAYTLTQGQAGNLAQGLHWFIPGAPMQNEGPFGINLHSLQGGRNASSLDDLRAAARKSALERQVALTNEALGEAVLNLKWLGIARVKVLPRYLPSLPGRPVTDTRTVVVTPARAQTASPFTQAPAPLLSALKQQLYSRRVLGERLFITASIAVRIRVKAELVIDDEADQAVVIEAATQQLNARLSDIQVPGSGLSPWPLGRPVTIEEIKTLLALVPGIMAVPNCQLAAGDDTFQEHNVHLQADELAVGDGYEWQVQDNRRDAAQTSREVRYS